MSTPVHHFLEKEIDRVYKTTRHIYGLGTLFIIVLLVYFTFIFWMIKGVLDPQALAGFVGDQLESQLAKTWNFAISQPLHNRSTPAQALSEKDFTLWLLLLDQKLDALLDLDPQSITPQEQLEYHLLAKMARNLGVQSMAQNAALQRAN